jgi:hypothetical protein
MNLSLVGQALSTINHRRQSQILLLLLSTTLAHTQEMVRTRNMCLSNILIIASTLNTNPMQTDELLMLLLLNLFSQFPTHLNR